MIRHHQHLDIVHIVFASICFFLIGCATSTPPDTNLKSGFRGIAWGTALTDAENMAVTKKELDESFVWAMREQDPQKIGDVPVDAIEYVFYNGFFDEVNVRFSGAKTFKALIRELEAAWGPANIEKLEINALLWKVDGMVVRLNFYRMPNSGTLNIMRKK